MAEDWLALASELARQGEPFALATVVRCEPPTSAKPGAKALIRADGRLSGWIGGSCAEPLVVREALEALGDGQPRLIALVGEAGGAASRREGVREHSMSCHSGGTLEIYVEPVLPKRQLLLVGGGPVVEALMALAGAVGFDVSVVAREEKVGEVAIGPGTAIVVATHGRFDEDALEWALRSEAAYLSLVASPKRADAVRQALLARGVTPERLHRLKAPAGLDLGAVTPEEIAVSILAELVRVRRSPALAVAAAPEGAAIVGDPVCGMSVDPREARYSSEAAGRRIYFCGARCKARFDDDPVRYAIGDRA